jgi:hypothetical protein
MAAPRLVLFKKYIKKAFFTPINETTSFRLKNALNIS